MTAGIYRLKNGGHVYYIGQSNNIERRYREHCKDKSKWSCGCPPTLEILEIVHGVKGRNSAEKRHIKSVGKQLINKTKGGGAASRKKKATTTNLRPVKKVRTVPKMTGL